MPLQEILDPQGKAVGLGLQNLGVNNIENVRIGRRIELEVEANSEAKAKEQVEFACKKLLANVIMEHYTFEVSQIS